MSIRNDLVADVTLDVRAYPACSKCNTPWIIRRAVGLLTGNAQWLFQRDCKCRRAEPVIVAERAARKGKR